MGGTHLGKGSQEKESPKLRIELDLIDVYCIDYLYARYVDPGKPKE